MGEEILYGRAAGTAGIDGMDEGAPSEAAGTGGPGGAEAQPATGRGVGEGLQPAAAPAVGELPPPHGGTLVDRQVQGEELAELRVRVAAGEFPAVAVDSRAAADLYMMAVGAYSPLTGFMGRDDYESVIETMHLDSGLPWSLPITLPISRKGAENIAPGTTVALFSRGSALAIMTVSEVFRWNPAREARFVYGTESRRHPGVEELWRRGESALAGEIRWIGPGGGRYDLTPAEIRSAFKRAGWSRVVGFQTRNPAHRAHEYIQKCALEMTDGLLLHPLTGPTRDEDVPADVRLRSYEVMIEHYYPRGRVLLASFPAPMRYAGPREAVFHAIVRKNYGCSHFIVGRDHAGVGDFYGPYESQTVFSRFKAEDLGITPLFFEHAFYCATCGGMATQKTCPHGEEQRLHLSGSRVRAMLRSGVKPPPEFSRPEVARVLAGSGEAAGPKEGAP